MSAPSVAPASLVSSSVSSVSNSSILFEASRVSVAGDAVALNFQDMSTTAGQSIALNLTTGFASEPASLAYLDDGLLGRATLRRRSSHIR